MRYPGEESSSLEFKAVLPKGAKLLQTVIAFSNGHGGKIVIGVKDNGEMEGVAESDAHAAMEWLGKCFYEACLPPVLPLVYQQRINDRVLLIIDVAAGTNKPYYQKSLGLENGTFVRLGRSTVRANADMIEELKWQARGISYDHLPLYHASGNDLDLHQVESFLAERRNGATARINNELLLAYHLLTNEHTRSYPTVAGMLLFGKDPQHFLSEAYILCSHFMGTEGREAVASRAIKGPLFEQFDLAYDFISGRLNKAFHIEGKKREERLEIPPLAIREVLMNAILHRNYHINAPIKVAIYNDRVEIYSPGSFPGPVDPSNLESGITYVRNTAIAKVLWESKYIEKMGSGLIELFRSYREYGLRPPVVKEGTNFVKCILPREASPGEKSDDEQLVLDLFRQGIEIARSDVVERLKIPKTTVGRLLNSLVEQGRLIRVGEGRSSRYRRP